MQVTDPLGGTTGIAYDKLRHVLQYHQPNNTSINYNYDVTYDILSVVNKKDSGEIISQYIYQYDPVGNRTSMTGRVKFKGVKGSGRNMVFVHDTISLL